MPAAAEGSAEGNEAPAAKGESARGVAGAAGASVGGTAAAAATNGEAGEEVIAGADGVSSGCSATSRKKRKEVLRDLFVEGPRGLRHS